MAIDQETRLALCQDVAFQSLGERQDTVILSLGSGYLYTCSPTTADLLQSIDGQRSLGQIADAMTAKYDIDSEVLRHDVLAMAGKLLEEKLVRIVN